jgi:hypothetical protein
MLIATDMTIADFTKIGSVCLRQGSTGTTSAIIDGIRVAGSWNDAPLPVSWQQFEVLSKNGVNELIWSTSLELNNSHFVIERSADGNIFEAIGSQRGMGTTAQTSNYLFTDEKPLAGINYYRIKQVDFDGAFSYSDVREVSNEAIIPIMTAYHP